MTSHFSQVLTPKFQLASHGLDGLFRQSGFSAVYWQSDSLKGEETWPDEQKDKDNDNDTDTDKTFSEHLQRAILDFCDIWDMSSTKRQWERDNDYDNNIYRKPPESNPRD